MCQERRLEKTHLFVIKRRKVRSTVSSTSLSLSGTCAPLQCEITGVGPRSGDTQVFSGCSALHWASCHGRLSAVKLLLDRGAALDFRDSVRTVMIRSGVQFKRWLPQQLAAIPVSATVKCSAKVTAIMWVEAL